VLSRSFKDPKNKSLRPRFPQQQNMQNLQIPTKREPVQQVFCIISWSPIKSPPDSEAPDPSGGLEPAAARPIRFGRKHAAFEGLSLGQERSLEVRCRITSNYDDPW
jgi:hypothetical protein